LPLPENAFDDEFQFDDESFDAVEWALGGSKQGGAQSSTGSQLPFALLRRELRWFHTQMHGLVPFVGEAPEREVAAASRIARWLCVLRPSHRGAFVLRYDGRRWPARLTRQFGGLTSIVVRFAAIRRSRRPNETLAEAEQAAVAELLGDIAAAGRPLDLTRRGNVARDQVKKLGRLRRAALDYVRKAEHAYFRARAGAPCAVPSSREGA